jgi:ribonuclease-3 family protein
LEAGVKELSYLGDAVFELLVREKLLKDGVPFKDMFKRAKGLVSARAQAEMYHRIFSALSETEQAMLKRGRNLHTVSRAKSADVTEYRHATGLETLFGFLHHSGETDRLHEIFQMCLSEHS